MAKGYLYTNKKDGLDAISLINKGEGIPVKGSLTETYCELYECEEGYYILEDEVVSKYLKNPTDIIIKTYA